MLRWRDSTADAICRAMGLPGFIEPGLPAPTLRVVLRPAFDPEVCLTLSRQPAR